MSHNKERDELSTVELATIVLLLAAFVYLISPWDILSFSFFDDLAFIIIALGFWVIVTKQTPRSIRKSFMSIGLMIIIVCSCIFGALLAADSWVQIDTGHALLIIDYTTSSIRIVNGEAAGFLVDGTKVMLGVMKTVDIYYSTDVYEDTIPCFSSDQLEMGVTIQMRWQLDPELLIELYRNYPKLDYEATAIDSIMEETIRFVTKNFTAVEAIAHRPEMAEMMQNLITQKMHEEPTLSQALKNLRFDLKNIAYPHNYTQAIEMKLVEQQKEQQAQFERNRILILANASAQEMIVKAYGEAQAKIAVAQGTQEAIQRIIQAAGTGSNATRLAELYISTEALKAIAPYIKDLIMVQGNALPLININTNSTTP